MISSSFKFSLFYAISVLFFLSSCSSTPSWVDDLRQEKEGRVYYTITVVKQNNERSTERVKMRAYRKSQEIISSEIYSHVKSRYQKQSTTEENNSFTKRWQRIDEFLKTETENLLQGVRMDDSHSEGKKFFLLVSIDGAEVQPTSENLSKKWEALGRKYKIQGDFVKASNYLEVASSFWDGSPEAAVKQDPLLRQIVHCQEKQKLWDEALQSIQRFLNRYPQFPEKSFWEKEIQRLQEAKKNG